MIELIKEYQLILIPSLVIGAILLVKLLLVIFKRKKKEPLTFEEKQELYPGLTDEEIRAGYVEYGGGMYEGDDFFEEEETKYRNRHYIDPKTGEYNLRYNMVDISQDFHLTSPGRTETDPIERKIYKIDVGDLPPDEIDKLMDKIAKDMYKPLDTYPFQVLADPLRKGVY